MYLRIAGIVLVTAGGSYALNLATRYLRARKYRAWQVTQGEIVRSEPVKWRTFVDDYGSKDAGELRYLPKVEFRYLADRLWYESATISPETDPEPGSLKQAQRVCRRYPKGAEVKVYYRPESPQTAVIVVPTQPARWGIFLAAVLLLAGSLLLSGILDP